MVDRTNLLRTNSLIISNYSLIIDLTHAWVNYETLLQRCFVGYAVVGEKPKDEDSDEKIEPEKEEKNDEPELDKETIKQITMFPAPEGHQISSGTKKYLLNNEDD